MYKSMALINGMLISVMILSNGLMVEVLTNTPSVVINHLIGLSIISIIFFLSKESWVSLKKIPYLYLFGGLSGLVTVYFTNISFLLLGATLTLMISMVGRIGLSLIVDHFGLLGMKKYPFRPAKIVGILFMATGIIIIILS